MISGCLGELELRFGAYCDGPQEAEQFTAEGRHDLAFVFAEGGECLIAFVQPVLRFLGDLFDFIAEGQRFLSSEKEACDVGSMLVGPGGLHQDPSEMSVACFCNPTSLNAVSAARH